MHICMKEIFFFFSFFNRHYCYVFSFYKYVHIDVTTRIDPNAIDFQIRYPIHGNYTYVRTQWLAFFQLLDVWWPLLLIIRFTDPFSGTRWSSWSLMPSRVSFAAYAFFPLWAILLLNKESPLMMSSPTVQGLFLLSFHMHWPRCQFHSCGRAYFSLCWFCLELIARWVKKKPNSE